MHKKTIYLIISIATGFLITGIIFNFKILSLFSFFILSTFLFILYKLTTDHSIDIQGLEIPSIITDENGVVISQNDAHRKFYGYNDEELLGKLDLTLPEEIKSSFIKEKKTGRELWIKTKKKNGEEIDTEIIRFFKKGKNIIIKYPLFYKSEIFSKFMETEKLAVLGTVASGLAHQLNTPLGTILLTAQMIKEEVNENSLKEDIETIENQVRYCQDIVRKLLTLSKPSEEEERVFNLVDTIREVSRLFEKTFQRNNIKFRLLASNESICKIKGKKNEISQVFMNLFSNSLDAMPDGGEIKVTISPSSFERIIIKVEDTGKGIDPSYKDKIFDPFFTTKPSSKGTGLGLSIAKRIVESHGGSIKLLDEGKGASFLIILPQSPNE